MSFINELKIREGSILSDEKGEVKVLSLFGVLPNTIEVLALDGEHEGQTGDLWKNKGDYTLVSY